MKSTYARTSVAFEGAFALSRSVRRWFVVQSGQRSGLWLPISI
jgi:hypothetical protein